MKKRIKNRLFHIVHKSSIHSLWMKKTGKNLFPVIRSPFFPGVFHNLPLAGAKIYKAFSSVMATVISPAFRQAASIFSFRGCTTISPGVRINFLTEDRGFPSANTVK